MPRAARPRFVIPAIALFAGVVLFAIPALRAADTEDDVLAGAIDLGDNTSGATYTTPATTTSDVTFAAGTTYTNAASFGLGTALSIGSLDDLNATPITINGTALLTLNAMTGANVVAPTGTPAGTTADSLYVASGASLTINDTAGIAVVNTSAFDVAGTLDLGTTGLTITAANTLSFTGAGATNVGGVIAATSGAVTVNKAGGIVTFGGANLYTGGTNITAGTLQLSGGNDRLLNTSTVNFTASSTLNLNGAISQTLGNITVNTASNVTGTVTGATAALTVTGTSFAIGGNTISTTQTLDLSGLGTFNYNNSAGTFKVGGTFSGVGGSTGTVKLAANSTITASSVGVGTSGTNTSSSVDVGTLNLGPTATINADTITLGTGLANGTIQYGVSTASPTLTLRGTNGSSRTNLTIGPSAGTQSSTTGLVDLTTNVTGTSTLDAMIGTLTIGNYTRTTATSSNVPTTGSLLMGGGTLDATTIILGQDVNDTAANHTYTTTGTLTVGATAAGAGTVKVQTLSLGNQNTSVGANTVTGIFNLNGGANLYVATIDKGTGTGTDTATRTFNWNAGTIHNYDANTDLTINSLASTGATTTFALLGTGAHTFNIDANRQGTVAQVISGTGAGGLTKAGAGTLTLSGANTYTGATMVTGGTLGLANTTGLALSGTASVAVNNGGTLLFSNSNQVKTTAPIALGTAAVVGPPAVAATTGLLSVAAGASQGRAATVTGGTVTGTAGNGGTITTGGTATGTTAAGLGALTLNNTATLAFAGGSTTLVFGTFTPNGNVLTVTGYVNTGAATTGSSGMGTDDRLVFSGDQSANLTDFNFGSGAGVGVSEIALDNGFYEVTAAAVPEPSTYVGGLMLLAGMAWTYRRQRQALRS